jgi:acetoacetyl-CoA synthetase
MQLNYAENILDRGYEGLALLYCTEPPASASKGSGDFAKSISFLQLRSLVARCLRGLEESGVTAGDHVAGYVANVPEAIVASLACASLGAVWSSASPDFGLMALCDRFGQIKPRLLFASSHYNYGGKTYLTEEVLKELPKRIPSIERIIAIPYPTGDAPIQGDLTWEEFLGADDDPELCFTQVPFEHPLAILFSSGTTGEPKCMIHGTGGTLLQHRKEHQLHCDLKEGDRLLFFTTCGWMMWNWQLSALASGTTVCLYDGSPAYPSLSSIWEVVDDLKVTHFGTSGRFLESCMKSQPPLEEGSLGELPRLRSVLYTGSPLSATGFKWVYESVKPDLHLAGISGGTDIVSCFVLGNPNLPVFAGEIQAKGLGVDVLAVDDRGRPVDRGPGELVCRKPLPSMPIRFLNDPDGRKYREAYFYVFPGLWRHGDYVEFTDHGGFIMHGRSDATLNPGGVRIGSAEIYAALDPLDSIAGAVVVGWTPPDRSDEDIVLLVHPQAERSLDHGLERKIRDLIRAKCSPRHVPKYIFSITGIPVTRSGKTVELAVKAVLANKPVSNRSALANPEVLQEIEEIRLRLLAPN